MSDLRVSIIIKAKNEERNIATAIESALAGLEEISGEVILADSASTDRTIEVSSGYPIKIVQIRRPEQACCGIGPQLGYQFAEGEYVCIMDADQTLDPAFAGHAVRYLETHPTVAGVTGRKTEVNFANSDSKARQAAHLTAAIGAIPTLNDLGFYRRAAIEEVEYFSDPNLHSYEELDLGVRLRTRGWELHRIDVHAMSHRGHDEGDYALLRKRWRSGYAFGSGELLRGALGRPHLKMVFQLREIRLWILVILWWMAMIAILALGFLTHWSSKSSLSLCLALALALAPVVAMSVKRRSIAAGLYSVIAWCVYAAGMIVGLCRRRRSPFVPVEAHMVKNG